jgi:murein DD-endopeptidase MepM/ murein hydrolase activator NlpD
LPLAFKKRLSFKQKFLNPGKVVGVAGIVIFFIMVLALAANENCPWEVRLGERVIAIVADKNAAQAALEELRKERVQASGYQVNISSQITFRRAGKAKRALVDNDTLKDLVEREGGLNTQAAAIYIDGGKKLVVPDQEIARELLASLGKEYNRNVNGRVAFAEDIQIKEISASFGEVLTFEEALAWIKKGVREERTYTVKDRDTLWDIASVVNMDVEKLCAINPGLSPECLQIGQKINLSQYSPLINVITTDQLTAREEIPFPVEEKEDDGLYKGQYKVVQKGKPGEKEVIYEVTYRNGLEETRHLVSEEILKEPTPQFIAKGSRLLLASRSGGSGRLAWPVPGAVVSPFGYRGREFHDGIDLGADAGVPVVAAESGCVVRAGWYGGYGKCVDIYHDSGVTTRYAHLSLIAVQEGEQVSRGQFIGYVGSTGNATGPHLHFEVITGEGHVNPILFF